MPARYGASPEDWAHFDLILGLGADLLPVVSNPNAVISPQSKMKDKGKVPSRYNKRNEVAGFPKWTEYQAASADIDRWSRVEDYGICLQTREVRALDIDVADATVSSEIAKFICVELGYLDVPKRYRLDSGKCLLAFRLPGEFAKRRIKVDGGIVEFLANGQQFIAVGTHPSGARYEWLGGLPDDFPTLTAEQFEALWSELVKQYAIEDPTTREHAARRKGEDVACDDPTLDALDVLSWGKDGQAFIECPFAGEHTTDSGETSTAYFPKGTRGYEQGHFVCLHAHCEGRSDADFLDALGIRAAEFDVMEDLPAVADEPERLPSPNFERNKAGEILATVGNLQLALQRPDVCKWDIRFDNFRDEIMWTPQGTGQWRSFSDEDYFYLRVYLESQGFKPVGRELIRDAVLGVSKLKRFDSAEAWLEGLPAWDGTPRIERFLVDCFGAEDTPYVRAVGSYIWTGLAGRVLVPGIKADMVPILEGAQGIMKSTAVKVMAPSPDFFCNISFNESEDNLSRKMRGRLIAEIGELRGLHTKELEAIKEFIAKTHEHWVPKYREFASSFPRRLIFIGTTNKKEFLADETGNRRWLPVHVERCDVRAIERNRNQLWAEGRELFKLVGDVDWTAEKLAAPAHAQYMLGDSWEESVNRWLDTVDDTDGKTPAQRDFLLIGEVLRHALNIDPRHAKNNDEWRIGKILRARGYEKKLIRVGGVPTRVWSQA